MNAALRDEFGVDDVDIKSLEEGMNLKKIVDYKNVFLKRFYKIDLKKYRLIANTKQIFKLKKCCK